MEAKIEQWKQLTWKEQKWYREEKNLNQHRRLNLQSSEIRTRGYKQGASQTKNELQMKSIRADVKCERYAYKVIEGNVDR